MRRILPITAALLALALLAGCGGDDDDSSADDAEPAAGEAKAPDKAKKKTGAAGGGERKAGRPGITIQTAYSQFGDVLFDSDDQAIYLFDKEQTDRSECYGACAAAWPPVLTQGEPRAEGGAQANLLGTTKRDDGTTQVTYNGHPLYYYVDDPPSQVLCHNVEEFGGLWLVLEPSGDVVQ